MYGVWFTCMACASAFFPVLAEHIAWQSVQCTCRAHPVLGNSHIAAVSSAAGPDP